MATITLILFTIFLILCIYIALHTFHRLAYFKQRNIPTPALPSIFYGHAKVLWTAAWHSDKLREWTKALGPIYGIFEGTQPVYVVSDPDFVQEVFITQFSKFNTRHDSFAFLRAILGKNRRGLSSSHGTRWKHQRQVLNPAYTSSKLRSLVPIMEECIQLFMNKFDENQNDANSIETDVVPRFKGLTMDVIGQTAFGVDIGAQTDDSNIYLIKANQLMTENFERSFLAKMNRFFPFLAPIWVAIYQLKCKINSEYISGSLWLANNVFSLVQKRVEGRETAKRMDLLQLMIDASKSETFQLTQPELMGNVFTVLLAGFATTSITLSFSAYILATHQDVQDKLYNEILNQSTEIEYDLSTTKMTYLDMFIKEILRMYPFATQAVHRECVEDADVNGYKIAKGARIQVDVLSIHFNEDLWGPLPVNEFHPERHAVKRHPMSFLTFGAGPRICIGSRFALMEIKHCLVHLLTDYRILPCTKKTTQLSFRQTVGPFPTELWVKLEKR